MHPDILEKGHACICTCTKNHHGTTTNPANGDNPDKEQWQHKPGDKAHKPFKQLIIPCQENSTDENDGKNRKWNDENQTLPAFKLNAVTCRFNAITCV